MSTTNFPGIKIFRSTVNNRAIAISNSGTGTPNDEIPIPTLLTGTLASISGATVVGAGTAFDTEVEIGQNLYFINLNGTPILVGKVQSINSATNITLTANASSSPASGSTLAVSQKFTGTQEVFLVRIPTVAINDSIRAIPNIAQLRQANQLNVVQYCSLSRTSAVGQPLVNSTFANVPFTLLSQNQFAAGALPNTRFTNAGQLPAFIWIQITPVVDGNNRLFQSTQWLHDWEENLPSIQITLNTPDQTLRNAGYVVQSGQTAGGAPSTN